MNQSKIAFLIAIAVLFGTAGFLHSERTKIQTFKERETERMISAERQAGFGDIEIDTLHDSINQSIAGLKKMVDLGVDKQAALYLPEMPATDTDIFRKDSEGKTYIQFRLAEGQSHVDWPKVYLYNGIGFIYPNDDFTELNKVVLMFRRVNADGTIYIKEMRRLINPTPRSPIKQDDGTYKIDTNSDIKLEYYQSFTSNTIWPDNPIQTMDPGVVMELNKTEAPLPYEKQRQIITQYKRILRKVDKDLATKLRGMELDQRRMVSKMLDFR